MASINKLSIRGVRSFSPNDNEQVVEFYFPCTIIVGANGCGKTTIIESLKFAVSGAMPPGNKSGQAFVHDPRSLGQNTVKANVKLRFTGRAGNSMVVVRSMEVTQKKTNMQFKQLDGVLRSNDQDGNRVSMGHKCSELDRQLPLLLGVSKAILEHVVFCHQEDSSWPLQEGAVLKKRFDDIFDSTRYSKALKVFSDLKKQYNSQAKDHKADVAGLSSHQLAAKGFRKDLRKHNQQLEEVEEEIDGQKKANKEVEEEQSRLNEIMKEMDSLDAQLAGAQKELDSKRESLKTMTRMVKEDLTQQHPPSELREMLRDFEAKRLEQLEQKADLEAELAMLQKGQKRIQDQENSLQTEAGRLAAMKEAHCERLKSRYHKMVELGNSYALGDVLTSISQSQQTQTQNTAYSMNSSRLDLSLVDQGLQEPILDISKEDLEDFRKAVDRKDAELREALKDCKNRHQQSEDDLSAKITSIKSTLGTIKSRRDEISTKQSTARRTLKKITTELAKIPRMRKSDLDEAQQNAAKYAKERDQINKDPRKSEIEVEIRDVNDKLDKLKRDMDDDKLVLKELQQSSESQQAILVLKQQISQEILNLEETLRDHVYEAQSLNMAYFPKNLPTIEDMGGDGSLLTDIFTKFVDEVSGKYEAKKLELDRASGELKKLEAIVSERKGVFTSEVNLLREKRQRMEEIEGAGGGLVIVRECLNELKLFETQLGEIIPNDISEAKPREIVQYLNDRIGCIDSDSTEGISAATIKKIMKALIDMARKEDDTIVCPCCDREISQDDDGKEILAMKKQLKFLYSSESPLVQGGEESKIAREKYSKWKDTISEVSHEVLEYRRLANEVKGLQTRKGELEEKLLHSTKQLQDEKASVDEHEEDAEKLRTLVDLANYWAEDSRKIATKRAQVKEKEINFSMSTGVDTNGRDLETVQREVDARQDERERFNDKLGRLNKELSSFNARINNINSQAERTRLLCEEKEKKMAEEQIKMKQKHELNEEIANYANEEKKLQEDLAPLEQKEKSREQEKQRLRKMNEEEYEQQNETLNNFLKISGDLKEIGDEIDKYEASPTEDQLANIQSKSDGFTIKLEEKTSQINAIAPKLQRIVKAVEDQEAYKKNLKDNLDLIDEKHHIKRLEKEVAAVKESQANVEGNETVYDDIENLRAHQMKIGKAIARFEGRRSEIIESIRACKRKLTAPEYKDVDEEYRIARIKYDTTMLAVKDLDKYHGALDKALLKFHSIKIEEINKIIRDLWTLTYKGEDITSIKIVSGQESGARASRSYNYRVVMTKGSTELDMRGRCSAGQRVLASIVIRLALAETFCLNFGCIALDEPTVNLDYENRRGLAVALAQIIASRAQQSNFQLIMITHDEDFVSLMKTELASQSGFTMPEKYFLVRREEGADGKFYSKIDAVDWEELV